tara:strand:- start:906 stop:1655 length:750 start_codon:yes stop_codon:yes gene_type:complete
MSSVQSAMVGIENMTLDLSKPQRFIQEYLDNNGKSSLIVRFELPPYAAYTSGDGIFRSDATLGRIYKFFRFSRILDFRKKSKCWNLSDDDREMLREIHLTLTFPEKGEPDYKSGPGVVYYIQFFGLGESIIDEGIRSDIRKAICKRPCANCGTTAQIECDHKNDLKNDPRVLNKNTQTIDDFQALCKHCNDVKRGALKRTKDSGKRHPAPGFPVAFTDGDETFNPEDPNWYVGTYWGDVADFKSKLSRQ